MQVEGTEEEEDEEARDAAHLLRSALLCLRPALLRVLRALLPALPALSASGAVSSASSAGEGGARGDAAAAAAWRLARSSLQLQVTWLLVEGVPPPSVGFGGCDAEGAWQGCRGALAGLPLAELALALAPAARGGGGRRAGALLPWLLHLLWLTRAAPAASPDEGLEGMEVERGGGGLGPAVAAVAAAEEGGDDEAVVGMVLQAAAAHPDEDVRCVLVLALAPPLSHRRTRSLLVSDSTSATPCAHFHVQGGGPAGALRAPAPPWAPCPRHGRARRRRRAASRAPRRAAVAVGAHPPARRADDAVRSRRRRLA